MSSSKTTCARIITGGGERMYVRGEWFQTRCNLFVSNGENAWICKVSEAEINERAQDWGFESSQEYLKEVMCRYLIQQQETSTYDVLPSRQGRMKLSWELQRESLTLMANFEMEPAAEPGAVTRTILDMLIDENGRLDESLQRKSRAFERMKTEADKCLAQSEKFKNEKTTLESELYKKFVAVLNSKKAKLRELRDAAQAPTPTPTPGRTAGEAQADQGSASEEETDEESGDDEPGSDAEVVRGSSGGVGAGREGKDSTVSVGGRGVGTGGGIADHGMDHVDHEGMEAHRGEEGEAKGADEGMQEAEGPDVPTEMQLRSAEGSRANGSTLSSASQQPTEGERRHRPVSSNGLGLQGVRTQGLGVQGKDPGSSNAAGSGDAEPQKTNDLNGLSGNGRPATVTSAAALLSGTGYTSAPRKRRL